MKLEIVHEVPIVEDYCALRVKAGLSKREISAARIGLNNSIFAVTVKNGNKLIGMGRVIGDAGCHIQVVDIAVEPTFQGQGVGRVIMDEIMDFIKTSIPRTCFVNLFADVGFLYQKYGFVDSTQSKGMYLDWSNIH